MTSPFDEHFTSLKGTSLGVYQDVTLNPEQHREILRAYGGTRQTTVVNTAHDGFVLPVKNKKSKCVLVVHLLHGVEELDCVDQLDFQNSRWVHVNGAFRTPPRWKNTPEQFLSLTFIRMFNIREERRQLILSQMKQADQVHHFQSLATSLLTPRVLVR